MEHTVYRRLLSAVCAIALAFTAVCPAVATVPEETTGTPQTLTASEVQEMQQTDAAVTALTDSAAYAGMSEEERQVIDDNTMQDARDMMGLDELEEE